MAALADTVGERLEVYVETLLRPVVEARAATQEVIDSSEAKPDAAAQEAAKPEGRPISLYYAYSRIVDEMGTLESRLEAMQAAGDDAARKHIQVSCARHVGGGRGAALAATGALLREQSGRPLSLPSSSCALNSG